MKISLEQAASLIREGKLAAFPTETVYGLGANALDAAAVAKIFELKGRPSTSPLIVHVSSIAMARKIATEWPREADELAQRYWPGPLTLVLRKSPGIPDIVTAGLPTVGIRVPSHPLALQLIEAAGVPIAAPSANRFMGLSPTTAEHVIEAFGDDVPVLDGGACPLGIESTVVSIADGKVTLLRPGMISIGEIAASAQESPVAEFASPLVPREADAHPSPGMHPRHYSPRTRLIVVPDPNHLPDRFGAYLWRRKSGLTARSVRMPMNVEAFAHRWYSVLHEVDGEGWPWIALESLPDKAEWAAIRDRVARACGENQ
jgi:L-threonylcarbamoyladenylate synthase